MKNVKRLNFVSILVVLFCISTVGVSQAFNPQPDPPGSVALGITANQTARLSVAYPHSSLFVPPIEIAITMSFIDADGNTLLSQGATLQPGLTVHLDLPGTDLLFIDSEREQIRARVDCLGDMGARLTCNGNTRASLELFNNGSGRTTILVPVTTTFLPPDQIVTTRPTGPAGPTVTTRTTP